MSTRLKILLPLAVAVAGLAAYLPEEADVIGIWGALALIATWAGFEYWVRRPMLHLRACAGAMAHSNYKIEIDTGADEMGMLGQALANVRDTLAREHARIQVEAEQRQRAEQLARESEERYALAVGGANDGLWEWNLRTGNAFFTARWKSMLGYEDGEIANDIDEWRNRIHPDDRKRALAELDAHVAGDTPRYECEQRMRHKDGRYRWMLVRGAAIKNASGKPYRLVGLNTDITNRKRVEEILIGISEGLASVRGEAFFLALVKNFAAVLGVRRAFITECCNGDEPPTRVRMLARWEGEDYAEPIEFDLSGTPCEGVIRSGRTCVYKQNIAQMFPGAVGMESYIGIPIFDSNDRILGHIACVDTLPIKDEMPVELIFNLYAVRAGLELERGYLTARLPRAA